MPHRRPPWWMYVVAASFLGLYAFLPYLVIYGPADPERFDARFTGAATEIRAVTPGSQVDLAGLRAGDVVTAIDGQAVRSGQDWQAVKANMEVGIAQHWEIERGGKQLILNMIPLQMDHTRPQFYNTIYYNIGIGMFYIVLGLLIAFRRPYDSLARIGAWFLLTAAIAFGVSNGWAVTWRHLPVLAQVLLWIPMFSRFVPEGIFLTFVAIFPRRLFQSRWPWALIWAPVLGTLPWRFYGMYSEIYRPGHATWAPAWLFQVSSLRAVIYLAAGAAILAVNYRRLADRNEKRRMRILVAGIVLSLISAIGIVWITQTRGFVMSFGFSSVYFFLPPAVACPAAFAYAILRHRLFDLGVMIRQGLQYALARGVVLSLVPAMGIVLVGDLLLHGDQPLIKVLAARGWIYAALGGLALLAHTQRAKWMQALDRRFFREHYDAHRLLREIVEEIREGGSLERVAPRTVASIESALHPEFAALLTLAPGESSYRSLAAAPAGQSPPPLPADSKLAALVRVLGKPLETPHSESGWLQQQLPHAETDFLRRARIDLLVPVATAPAGTEALLALGVKKSEEPYSREDQDLLEAIAASLALLLAKPQAPAEKPGEAFEECPECGACYDTGSGQCTRDNSGLTVTQLPRLLAGRYRLDHRRGRGGMGAVYEAVDTALERRVAVKVIRDELVGNTEAAERFQREARAAASFTHPNVVTIYDFGVADTRAFLVMELLEGVSLRDELKRSGRLAADRVLSLMRGVCFAVEAAHRRQLVHRDLKPENIFLARGETGETAKVLDFGIAKFLPQAAAGNTLSTADTGTGALMGTVRYMSPEQLRGGKVGTGWDLWALAVVAYEILTGAHPFQATTAAEYHSAILSGRVTPIPTHVPDSPQSWQEFFARALALDPAARPASAQELLVEMERALT
jgi:tRNA A-37 threonylcarbamoyl transferase component Bud32/membrane-associated protease RseP (regulator of RpoE activity)